MKSLIAAQYCYLKRQFHVRNCKGTNTFIHSHISKWYCICSSTFKGTRIRKELWINLHKNFCALLQNGSALEGKINSDRSRELRMEIYLGFFSVLWKALDGLFLVWVKCVFHTQLQLAIQMYLLFMFKNDFSLGFV